MDFLSICVNYLLFIYLENIEIYKFFFQGIFAENKEKLINNAIQALSNEDSEATNCSNKELEAQFHALRRLFASKIGFTAFTVMQG